MWNSGKAPALPSSQEASAKPVTTKPNGEAYKRGPYITKANSASAAKEIKRQANAVARAAQGEAKSTEDKLKIGQLTSQVELLKQQVTSLQNQLTQAQSIAQMQVNMAKLEEAQKSQSVLLTQYQAGLKDGAALTMGSKLNVPPSASASTPSTGTSYSIFEN